MIPLPLAAGEALYRTSQPPPTTLACPLSPNQPSSPKAGIGAMSYTQPANCWYLKRRPHRRRRARAHTPPPAYYRCFLRLLVGRREGYRARPARVVPGKLPASRLRQGGGAKRAGVLLLFQMRRKVLLSGMPGTYFCVDTTLPLLPSLPPFAYTRASKQLPATATLWCLSCRLKLLGEGVLAPYCRYLYSRAICIRRLRRRIACQARATWVTGRAFSVRRTRE